MSQTPVAPKRMGRPPEHGPVVAVDIDGEVLMWCQGALTGPGRLRGAAAVAGVVGQRVPLVMRGAPVEAALPEAEPTTEQEWIALAACLVAASPGRARLIEAPQTVWDFLEAQGPGCLDRPADPEIAVTDEIERMA